MTNTFDADLLIEATTGKAPEDIGKIFSIPLHKASPSEEMVGNLVAISDQMASGQITSEQGKAASAELRKSNPEHHADAMKIIGERYGFAAEDAEMERRAKKGKSKLERAGTKKPWAHRSHALEVVKKDESADSK